MRFPAEPRVLEIKRRAFLRPPGASREEEKEEVLFGTIVKRYYGLLYSPLGTGQKSTYCMMKTEIPRLLIHAGTTIQSPMMLVPSRMALGTDIDAYT